MAVLSHYLGTTFDFFHDAGPVMTQSPQRRAMRWSFFPLCCAANIMALQCFAQRDPRTGNIANACVGCCCCGNRSISIPPFGRLWPLDGGRCLPLGMAGLPAWRDSGRSRQARCFPSAILSLGSDGFCPFPGAVKTAQSRLFSDN